MHEKVLTFASSVTAHRAGTRQILFSQKDMSCNVEIDRRSDMRKMIAMAVAGFVWRQLRTRLFARRQAGRMARRGRF